MKVYTAEIEWENLDGHGSQVLGVFPTEEAAQAALTANRESFFGDVGVLDQDGTVHPDAMALLDGDDTPSDLTKEQLLEAESARIDDTTTSFWTVTEHELAASRLVRVRPGTPAETVWEGDPEDELAKVQAISDELADSIGDFKTARFSDLGRAVDSPTIGDICAAVAAGATVVCLNGPSTETYIFC